MTKKWTDAGGDHQMRFMGAASKTLDGVTGIRVAADRTTIGGVRIDHRPECWPSRGRVNPAAMMANPAW